MLGAMAQPEKSAAAVHAKAMLEALTEILKSQRSPLLVGLFCMYSRSLLKGYKDRSPRKGDAMYWTSDVQSL